jgi:fatty-acyl-CoA synthase
MNIPLTPLRFLRYARDQFPDKVGVVCGDQRFTYAQFADRAFRLAGALVAAGAEPGDRIAFLSTNCHRLLEAYYGVLEARCILLPLNIRLAFPELASVFNDAQPRLLYLEPAFLPLGEPLRKAVPSIEQWFLLEGEAKSNGLAAETYEDWLAASSPFESDLTRVDENSVAELFYTSGSSDRPKGVMLTHRNVYLHALALLAATQTSPVTIRELCCTSVMLHTIPLFHANGWGTAHTITTVGGTHVMIHHFTPAEVFRLIEGEGVTSCCMVPTMLSAVVHSPDRAKYNLSSLKTILVGGAASSPALLEQAEQTLGCSCICGYGLTETSPVLAKSPLKATILNEAKSRHVRQAMTGFAIPGVELRVVGVDGKQVPYDHATFGEVVARGDMVMDGYWRQPQATQAAMEGGWFHTGDVATIDSFNYLQIVDRKKEIIVSGGENISSLEVEKVLCAHPSVYETAVIPVPDQQWGEIPKAFVVLKPDTQATEGELIEFCRARLSHYKCPRSIELVQALPKTGTGKILKRELRKKYWSSERSAGS